MSITFNEYSRFVKKSFDLRYLMDEYLDSIPSDIKSAIFDNTYSNLQATLFDNACKLLPHSLYMDFDWIYYTTYMKKRDEPFDTYVEFSSVDSCRRYTINNIDEYLDYVKNLYFGKAGEYLIKEPKE